MEQEFYMTRLYWDEEWTQSVWNVCINFDTWNNSESCNVLEETLLRYNSVIEKVRA